MVVYSSILAADVWFENILLGIRSPFFLHIFSGMTFVGDFLVVATIAVVVGIFLLFHTSHRPYVLGLATTLIGAIASEYVAKMLVGRARPSGLIPSTIEFSSSFPSGHATLAIAFYGFLAFLFCRMYPAHKRLISLVAVVLILAVGFSRLYLGVHFPSDVIAGYLLGGLWLLIGIVVQTRRQSFDTMDSRF